MPRPLQLPDTRPVRAVVFDHDGTLVDSLAVVVAASNAVLASEGLAPRPASVIIAGMVLPTPERLGALLGTSDPEVQAALGRRYDARALELAHGATSYPGISLLLSSLRHRRLPLAVVSNSARAFLEAALGHAGLRRSFTHVLGADEVPRPKPDPAGLLQVLERLHCPPESALYVGDSLTDLRTAQAAGVRSIGVTWGAHPRAELAPLGFEALVDHPAQLLHMLDTWHRASRPLMSHPRADAPGS